MTVLERIRQQLEESAHVVMLRRDFQACGSTSQVHRALRVLVEEKSLVRIGLGLYAKTRISSVTGQVIPSGSLETLATAAMRRLGIEVQPGAAARAYNAGESTQLPGLLVADTGRRKIQRVIEVGGRRLIYERGAVTGSRAAPKPPALDRHGAQDLQSRLLHEEAVRMLRAMPSLVVRLEETLKRWRQRQDPTTQCLLDRWEQIIAERDWDAALAQSELGQQLRQASPLTILLPVERRLATIRSVKALKRAI